MKEKIEKTLLTNLHINSLRKIDIPKWNNLLDRLYEVYQADELLNVLKEDRDSIIPNKINRKKNIDKIEWYAKKILAKKKIENVEVMPEDFLYIPKKIGRQVEEKINWFDKIN